MHVVLSTQSFSLYGLAHFEAARKRPSLPPALCSLPMYTSLSPRSVRSRRQARVGSLPVGADAVGDGLGEGRDAEDIPNHEEVIDATGEVSHEEDEVEEVVKLVRLLADLDERAPAAPPQKTRTVLEPAGICF